MQNLTTKDATAAYGRNLFDAGCSVQNAAVFAGRAREPKLVEYFEWEFKSLELFHAEATLQWREAHPSRRFTCSACSPALEPLVERGDYLGCITCGRSYYLDGNLALQRRGR